jgi:hypothetical protein
MKIVGVGKAQLGGQEKRSFSDPFSFDGTAAPVALPFLCKVLHFTPFFAKCLCKLTKRNFLKPLDILHPLWYNTIVVKGRKVNGKEKPTTATRKKFLKKFSKTP